MAAAFAAAVLCGIELIAGAADCQTFGALFGRSHWSASTSPLCQFASDGNRPCGQRRPGGFAVRSNHLWRTLSPNNSMAVAAFNRLGIAANENARHAMSTTISIPSCRSQVIGNPPSSASSGKQKSASVKVTGNTPVRQSGFVVPRLFNHAE